MKASKNKDRKPAAQRRSTTKAAKKVASKKVASTQVAKRPKVGKRVKVAAQKSRTGSVTKVKSLSMARAKGRFAPPAAARIAVKALQPQAKCGAGTSVRYLFRVDETVDGRTMTHLVFFDRHGWYCEHGRNCPAVAHAKKYQGHMARAS